MTRSIYIFIYNRHTRKSLESNIRNEYKSWVEGQLVVSPTKNDATATVSQGGSVVPRQNKSLTSEMFLKRVSNSPLCNSSPRASGEFTKRYFGFQWTPVFMCILVERVQGRRSTKQAWSTEVFVRREVNASVRYRIRALLHLAEAPFISRTQSETKWQTHEDAANSQQHKLLLPSPSWSGPVWH